MKRVLIAISLLCSELAGFSADYGRLKVQIVDDLNTAHTNPVHLKLNGIVALSFAHNGQGSFDLEITSRFLAVGKSTPMVSDYGSLGSGCSFRFKILYTMGNGTSIPLGTYNAPTTGVNKPLPLGLCDGMICSSNPHIQDQIEAERWKANGEAIKRWLEQGIENEKRQLRELRERLGQKAAALKREVLMEQEIAKALSDVESIENPRRQDEHSAVDINKVISQAIESGRIDQLIKEIGWEEQYFRDCQTLDAAGQYLCANYGSLGWIVGAAEGIAILLDHDPNAALSRFENRILDPSVRERLTTEVEKRAEMRFQIQAALDAKRSREIWQDVTTAARFGLGFTPLDNAISVCEALSGRTLCLPQAKELNSQERFEALMSVILSSKWVWTQVEDALKVRLFVEVPANTPQASLKVLSKDLNRVRARSAQEVNELLMKEGYSHGPYKPGSRVFEFTTHVEIRGAFARVYSDEAGKVGRWVLEKKSIEGLSAQQIKDKFALPTLPKYVVDVDIPASVTLRKGVASPIHSSTGERFALQYEFAMEKWPGQLNFEASFSAGVELP